MSRVEDRVMAALLEHSSLPDHSGMADEDLLERLAVVLAGRAECAVEAVAIVGTLRSREVKFEVIRDRSGLPLGTAHRWNGLYQSVSSPQPASREGDARS